MKRRESALPPEEAISRFPQSKEAIRRLYGQDEAFRELCGDYAECLVILDRLRRAEGGCDERIEQYCELRVNLEHELLSRISTPPEGPDGRLRPAPGDSQTSTEKNRSRLV